MTAPASPDTTQEWGGTRFHVGPGRERTPTMGEIMRVRRCTLPNCAGGKGAHQINSQPIAYSSTPQIKLRVTLTGLHIYLGKRGGPSLILAALRTPGGFPSRSAREASPPDLSYPIGNRRLNVPTLHLSSRRLRCKSLGAARKSPFLQKRSEPSFWSRGQKSFSKCESPPWVGSSDGRRAYRAKHRHGRARPCNLRCLGQMASGP